MDHQVASIWAVASTDFRVAQNTIIGFLWEYLEMTSGSLKMVSMGKTR